MKILDECIGNIQNYDSCGVNQRYPQ